MPHGPGGNGDSPKPGKSTRTDGATRRSDSASGNSARCVWPHPCPQTSKGARPLFSPSSRKTAISAPPAHTVSRLGPLRLAGGGADCAAVGADLISAGDTRRLWAVPHRERAVGRRVHRARRRHCRLGYRMLGKNETRVAVFLGGRSPEHDVSVITGLQALKAIDPQRFVPVSVYFTPPGAGLVWGTASQGRHHRPHGAR